MSLIRLLETKVEDPRRKQGLRVTLPQMLSIIIVSNLCGHYGGRAVAKFGKHHQKTFTDLLQLKHPVPSHVVFSDLTNRLDENQLIDAFNEWSKDYVHLEKGELVSGDGKSLGSTVSNGTNSRQTFSAIVSLFCQKSGLVHSIKQYANAKESEIDIVRFLVNELKAKGLVLFF
ncbi:MAG: ISAs1 family transposase [Bacteroidota bacterium]